MRENMPVAVRGESLAVGKVTSEAKEAPGAEERGGEGSIRKGLLDEGGDRLHWAVKGRLSSVRGPE